MSLYYENLDSVTRRYMLDEYYLGNHYQSKYLNDNGVIQWPNLLRTAICEHDDKWLEKELYENRLFRNKVYQRRGTKQILVSIDTKWHSQVLAEGEFNRYYLRGISKRAIEEGIPYLEIYRGKQVKTPRNESSHKIGQLIDPHRLLTELRKSDFVNGDIGIVSSGPGSGLTAKFKT